MPGTKWLAFPISKNRRFESARANIVPPYKYIDINKIFFSFSMFRHIWPFDYRMFWFYIVHDNLLRLKGIL